MTTTTENSISLEDVIKLRQGFERMIKDNNYLAKKYSHLGFKDNLPALMNMLQIARKLEKEIRNG